MAARPSHVHTRMTERDGSLSGDDNNDNNGLGLCAGPSVAAASTWDNLLNANVTKGTGAPQLEETGGPLLLAG